MAVNNFDLLAPYYDGIARLVFGDKLTEAQIQFLDTIKIEDTVLILGGGTGKILTQVPRCKKIDFVEKSSRMIEIASNRHFSGNVEFINADFHSFSSSKYDLVICPFFLDCFKQDQLENVIKKIKSLLNPEGLLLVADFRMTKSNVWTLKFMHYFFKFFANLEARYLLDIHQIVISAGFEVIKEKFLHRNQLFSRLYRNL